MTVYADIISHDILHFSAGVLCTVTVRKFGAGGYGKDGNAGGGFDAGRWNDGQCELLLGHWQWVASELQSSAEPPAGFSVTRVVTEKAYKHSKRHALKSESSFEHVRDVDFYLFFFRLINRRNKSIVEFAELLLAWYAFSNTCFVHACNN